MSSTLAHDKNSARRVKGEPGEERGIRAGGPLLHYDLPFEPRPIKATVKGDEREGKEIV